MAPLPVAKIQKMEKTILLNLLLACSIIVSAQSNPPKSIIDSFSDKYHNAKNVEWEQESENEWEVEFVLEDQEMSSSFNIKLYK